MARRWRATESAAATNAATRHRQDCEKTDGPSRDAAVTGGGEEVQGCAEVGQGDFGCTSRAEPSPTPNQRPPATPMPAHSQALKHKQNKFTLYKENPRMVPRNLNPECQKMEMVIPEYRMSQVGGARPSKPKAAASSRGAARREAAGSMNDWRLTADQVCALLLRM